MEVHTVKKIALSHDDLLDILAKKFRCSAGDIELHATNSMINGAIITIDVVNTVPVGKRDKPILPSR